MSLPHPLSAMSLSTKSVVLNHLRRKHLSMYMVMFTTVWSISFLALTLNSVDSRQMKQLTVTLHAHFTCKFLFLELYRRGASIVVDNFRVADVYSQLLFNPLCFLLYENTSQSPKHWENVCKSKHAINVNLCKYGGGNRVVCSMICLLAHATVDIYQYVFQ